MLSIRSFEKNQTLVGLINKLITHFKFKSYNIDDNVQPSEIERAKEILIHFLESIVNAISDNANGNKIVKGVDMRERVFIRKFIDAQKKQKHYKSLLFKDSPSEVITLLKSSVNGNTDQLIESLSDLRNLINEHLAIDLKDLVGDI